MFKSSTKRLCPSPWALGKHPNWSTLLVLNLPLWDLFFAPLKKESSLLQQSEAIHITTFVRMQFQSSSFEGFLNLRLSRTNGKLNLKLDGFVLKKRLKTQPVGLNSKKLSAGKKNSCLTGNTFTSHTQKCPGRPLLQGLQSTSGLFPPVLKGKDFLAEKIVQFVIHLFT